MRCVQAWARVAPLALFCMLAACSGRDPSRARVCDLSEAKALLAGGHLERAQLALARPDCRSEEASALVGKIRTELLAPGDVHALLAQGRAARDKGDEVLARRSFDHARALAEAAARSSAKGIGGESLVMADEPWSPDGHYAVYSRYERYVPWGTNALLVLDVHKKTAFRIDAPTKTLFAPDGRHLVLHHYMDDVLSVMDLQTGATRLERRHTDMDPVFAPDGRLVWAERVGSEDRLYLRDLATGAETVLRAPAQLSAGPPLPDAPRALPDQVRFAAGWIMMWAGDSSPVWGSPATIHVWDLRNPTPLVSVAGLAQPAPTLEADGLLTYGIPNATDKRGIARSGWLRFVDLRSPGSTIVLPARSPACGAGDLGPYSGIFRCSSGRYAVWAGGRACVWDVRKRSLVTILSEDEDHELSCSSDVVALRAQGGCKTCNTTLYYSAITGRFLRRERADDRTEYERFVEEEDRAPIGNRKVSLADGNGRLLKSDKAPVTLADSVGAGRFSVAPKEEFVSGISLDDRAMLWSAKGELVWESPHPGAATSVAFSPTDQLVAVGAGGRIWRVDLSSRQLRTTPPPAACEGGSGAGYIGVMGVVPDGRVVLFCTSGVDDAKHLVVEGVAAPIATVTEQRLVDMNPLISTSPTSATAVFLDNEVVYVWSVPDGKLRWSRPLPTHKYPIGISADGTRLVTTGRASSGVQVYGEPPAPPIWEQELGYNDYTRITFSSPGTRMASALRKYDGPIEIRDPATGQLLDKIRHDGSGLAFDPTGSLITYWRPVWNEEEKKRSTDPIGLGIRDLGTKKEIRQLYYGRLKIDREVDSIAWSPAGRYIAAITQDAITVWDAKDPNPLWTILLYRDGAALIDRTGAVSFLGDSRDARAVLWCRVGAQMFPYELCER